MIVGRAKSSSDQSHEGREAWKGKSGRERVFRQRVQRPEKERRRED
jgi:hypothetical protein